MAVKNVNNAGGERTYIVALLAGAVLLLVVAWTIYQKSLLPKYDYYNQPGSTIHVNVAEVDARIKAMEEAAQEMKDRSTITSTSSAPAPTTPVAPVVPVVETSQSTPSQPVTSPAPDEYTPQMISDREKAMMQGLSDIMKQNQ